MRSATGTASCADMNVSCMHRARDGLLTMKHDGSRVATGHLPVSDHSSSFSLGTLDSIQCHSISQCNARPRTSYSRLGATRV